MLPSSSNPAAIDNGDVVNIDGPLDSVDAAGIRIGSFFGALGGTVSIVNGGSLLLSPGSTSEIGSETGTIGSVVVDGFSARWNGGSSNLTVGYNGEGNVIVRNAGTMNLSTLYIGEQSGRGTVTVSSGGVLNVYQDAHLGRGIGSSHATLDVSGGGRAFLNSLSTGLFAPSTVNVSGPGSWLFVTSTLTVGEGSTGSTLNLGDEGKITVGNGSGTINIGNGGLILQTFSIGGAAGSPAVAPGTVEAGAVNLSASSQLIFNHTAPDYAFSPQITGSGRVAVNSGTTILERANTYSGGTVVNFGALVVKASGALGSGAVSLNTETASLTYDGAGVTAGPAAISLNNSSKVTFRNGASAGSANITIPTDLSPNLGMGLFFTENSSAGNATITNVFGGGYQTVTFGDSSTAGSASITNGSGAVTSFENNSSAGAASITNNGGSTFLQNNATGGTASFVNTNGSLEVAGSSNLESATVTNGTMGRTYIYGNASGGNARIINDSSGFLDISGVNGIGTTVGSIEGAGEVRLGAKNLTVGSNGQSTTVSGTITSPTGSLTKTGAGTLTLTGANTYTGGTTINDGTLALSGAGSLAASGSLDLAGAGTGFDISASAANQTIGSLSGFGNVVLGVNTLTFGNVTNQTFAGSIGGTGGIVKQGSGRQTLAGINTYLGGTTITAGTLALIGAGSLAASGGLNLAGAGAELDIGAADGSRTIGGLSGVTGSTIWLGANTLTFGNATNQTFAGSIGGTGGITKQGIGRQTLTGANTYTGGTTINDGTLALSGAGSLAASSSLSLSGTGAGFDISGASGNRTIGALSGGAGSTITLGVNTLTFGNATNQVFAGSIGGTGGIVKQGGGRQTLTGTSSYGGTTTVASGELRVDGALTGLGALTVAAGATLSGTSSIAGAVTVDGTLSAGHSPGTLTVGSLTLNSGSTSVFELNTPGVVGGSSPVTGNDLVEVTGNLTLGGALDARAAAAGYYRLFDYGGTLSGGFDSQSITSTRSGFTIASAQVDTTVPGQVNLGVLGTGQTMQFWDGANTSGNGTVDGGAGTWTGFGTNWTNSAGSANAGWGGSVGIFAGAAGGAVSVSGTVSFDTLQFATNGYVLSGGTLSIAPASGAAGTFNADNGVVASIASTIADGSGTAIDKVGGGTLILSGNNTYTGGTTISGGTLSISSDTNLGGLSGGLSLDGGTLRTTTSFSSARNVVINAAGGIFRTNADLAWSGVISGSGALTKTGNGMLTLTGTNSYAGGTTITGGVLQIGDGGTSGSITGAVVNNRTLAFNRSDDIAFAGAISGTGDVQKRGAGSLTLTGTNTYSGGTFIAQGTLIGSASSFGVSQIMNNGALVIDQPTDASFANMINGTGSFTKRGAGNLSLTGTSALIGSTAVEDGKLSVNGSLASSPVTVAGGVLGGTGTIGGLAVQSGGTVAPGNSIGTLNVSGNVAFAPGSVYALEINGAGQSDRIAATGTATLSGGTVQILPDQGTRFRADHAYTILTAQGGVSGRFAGTQSAEFAFISPTLGYATNAVTLTMVRKTTPTPPTPPPPTPPTRPAPLAFHTVAVTENQYRTADAVEALGAGNRLYNTALGSSVSGARQAFDALSGEAHAPAVSVAYEDSRLVREAILARLREPLIPSSLPRLAYGSYGAAFAADRPGKVPPVAVVPQPLPPRYSLWGEGFGSWGHVRSNHNAAALEASTGGFILGADALVSDGLRLGLAGGYTHTSFDVDARLSSGLNESVFAALYGSGHWGSLNLRLGAAYARHDFDLSRTISFPAFADATKASYDGSTLQAFGELGYRLGLGGVEIEPFAGAAVRRLATDSFREQGGAAALTGLGRTYELGTTTLGVRAAARISEEVPLTVKGLLGWRHAYGDVEPEALLAFAGSTSPFVVTGVPVDRDALVAEAGLDWQASAALSLGITYTGQIGNRAQDHALKGNLVWKFGTY